MGECLRAWPKIYENGPQKRMPVTYVMSVQDILINLELISA